MNNLLVITHDDCLLKNNGNAHPERKERLETIVNSIKEINDIKIEFKEAFLAKNFVYLIFLSPVLKTHS